jgi:hypothetical protein
VQVNCLTHFQVSQTRHSSLRSSVTTQNSLFVPSTFRQNSQILWWLFGQQSHIDVAFQYYIKALVRSNMLSYIRLFADLFVRFPGATLQIIQNALTTVIGLICECPKKPIRVALNVIIFGVLVKVQVDNDLIICLIVSVSEDWKPMILEHGRTSFDMLRIDCDFAKISERHTAHIIDEQFRAMLETFITSAIPEFVATRVNGVSFERFLRSCDMTYLLK